MIFHETALPGAFRIELERHTDERGFFARSFCVNEFRERGLDPNVAQCNVSMNEHRGTLRGMHYQIAPSKEAKLVRCTRGSIYDVIVDLRPGSDSNLRWIGVELAAEDHTMLYIPEGFAHGFITLDDRTEVFYQMSEFHAPDAARGFRWDDPKVGIEWPIDPVVISQRDAEYAPLDAAALSLLSSELDEKLDGELQP